MPAKATNTKPKSNNTTNTSPTASHKNQDIKPHLEHSEVVAFALTAAIVAFVGAIVVLTIPYAILGAPLPPAVNRLGLSVEATQGLLFEHVWYLLVPSLLFALWIGYRFYQWGCSITPAVRPGKLTVDTLNDQEPPTSAETGH